MDRLTYISDGYYAVDSADCWEDQNEAYSGPAIDRLAVYEDTGLEPEEVVRLQLDSAYGVKQAMLEEYMSIGKIDHLRELARAEQDGRLVVLPFKKGDRLFVLTSDSPTGIEETKAKNFIITYRENGPCIKVVAPCVYDDWGGAFREFYPEDFGKTVFLTRKEAEAALAGK